MDTIWRFILLPAVLTWILIPWKIAKAEDSLLPPAAPHSLKVATNVEPNVEAKIQLATRAAEVLDEIMKTPDQGIPLDLLSRAECVAVFPSTLEAGFVVGAQYGYGLVSCRRHGPDPWGAPAFFTLAGGSLGVQIGVKATDLILLVMNEDAKKELLDAKITLGAGLGVAAGPVGRDAGAATDASLQASILSYSHSEGLFVGVDLGGSILNYDGEATKEIYGRKWDAKTVLLERQDTAPALQAFPQTLRKYAPPRLS